MSIFAPQPQRTFRNKTGTVVAVLAFVVWSALVVEFLIQDKAPDPPTTQQKDVVAQFNAYFFAQHQNAKATATRAELRVYFANRRDASTFGYRKVGFTHTMLCSAGFQSYALQDRGQTLQKLRLPCDVPEQQEETLTISPAGRKRLQDRARENAIGRRNAWNRRKACLEAGIEPRKCDPAWDEADEAELDFLYREALKHVK